VINRKPLATWYRRISLRARIIIATALVLVAVVVTGGAIIVQLMRGELVDAADDAGESRARELVMLARQGDLPPTLLAVGDEEAAVQVVAGGQVVSASANLAGAAAVDLPRQPAGTSRVLEASNLPLAEAGPYRVTARGVSLTSGSATIYVAIAVDDVEETVAAAVRVAVIGLALLVLAVCAVMWTVIGRTLARVDAIRDRAEAISGRNLDWRVPEPAYDDEIGRLARTFNAMLARLQCSADRQQRFVADAAHELRSPIASLRAQIETASDGDGAQGRIEMLRPDLLADTLRMQVLVDQMLLLARSDDQSLLRTRRTVDFDDSVDIVVSSALAHARVPLDRTAVQPVQVSGDADLLEQVVRNLLDNALRHAESAVHVGLSRHGTHAVLTVDDDGPGIAEQHRADVFRRFTRLDVARDRDGGGVGLGLAIVSGIVSAHEGTIEVTCSPVGGARFTVRLPLADPAMYA